jgi:hypothetical protein
MMASMDRPKRIRDPRLPRLDAERAAMRVAVNRLLDSIHKMRAAEKRRVLQ